MTTKRGRGGIHLRRAVPEDCERIYRWRNHPSVRKFSASTKKIDFQSHREWFSRVLRSRDQVLLIAVKDDEEVGVIRFDVDKKSQSATISIYVKPFKHHHGIGTQMMKAGEEWLRKQRPQIRRILATIKKGNTPSLRLFRRAGFHQACVVFTKDL